MKRLLTEASLIMKPEGQADGLLPSVKPIDGSGDFTFSRGSNLAATRVNQAGLIEKGRENLLVQSNQFDTTWTTGNITTLTSSQSGYNGSNDAWLVGKSASSNAYLKQNISSSGVNTFSLYAKPDTLNGVLIQTRGASTKTAQFDLSTGTLGTAANNIDAKIEDIGSGWYRCSVSVNDSAITQIRIFVCDDGTAIGTTAGSIYIQDAQLEVGIVATPYIETTTTTAKAGVLEDAPRLDYSGGATEPSLLLEPQRSNLITYSEYLNGSIWAHNSTTATINADVSPSGYNDATSLYISLANAAVFSRAQFTNVANSTHLGSVFLKKVEGSEVRLRISGTAASLDGSAIFNLDNGTYRDAVGSVTPSIESVGNGWYRCSIGDLSGSGIATPSFRIDTLGAQNDTTVLVWGAVVEVGAYPTSYIPTNGSAVTRSADDCSVTGVSDVIGQSEGTLFVEADLTDVESTTTRGIAELNDGGTLNRITLFRNSNGTIRLFVRNGGTAQMDETFATPPSGVTKIAIGYALNNIVLYVNGTQVASDTSASIPACSELDLGQMEGNLTKALGDALNQALVFPTRLTNAELAALTTL